MHSRTQNEKNTAPLLARVDELRREVGSRDPRLLAQRTGSLFTPTSPGEGLFHLNIFNREVIMTYPELEAQPVGEGRPLNPPEIALLMYYFHTADGAPPSKRWIAFSGLPDGRFYNQAFQGYTGRELARVYGQNPEGFARAALQSGGARQKFGDLAFEFPVLPHLTFLAVLWQGDEDFPSSCQILFDTSASHYLPTDACAVAGSLLTHRILAAGN
jgi:hypothetical protein